jgi:hypothetical protein
MVPRWMLLDRMKAEIGALRRRGAAGDAGLAIRSALDSYASLSVRSDEEALRRAWHAIERAGHAVARVERLRAPDGPSR